MSLATVRAAFEDVFQDSQVQAITPKFYNYEILEDSNLDARKFRSGHEINFFIFLVTKSIIFKPFGCELETYNVEIKYYKEDDKAGNAQNEIRDAFEVIHSRILDVIGRDWGDSVDYYQPASNLITLNTIQLDDRSVWLGRFSYNGFKTV
jgi:hypothetical protein